MTFFIAGYQDFSSPSSVGLHLSSLNVHTSIQYTTGIFVSEKIEKCILNVMLCKVEGNTVNLLHTDVCCSASFCPAVIRCSRHRAQFWLCNVYVNGLTMTTATSLAKTASVFDQPTSWTTTTRCRHMYM